MKFDEQVNSFYFPSFLVLAVVVMFSHKLAFLVQLGDLGAEILANVQESNTTAGNKVSTLLCVCVCDCSLNLQCKKRRRPLHFIFPSFSLLPGEKIKMLKNRSDVRLFQIVPTTGDSFVLLSL